MIFPQVAVRSLVQQTTRAGRPGGQDDSLPWQGRFVRFPAASVLHLVYMCHVVGSSSDCRGAS